MSEEVPPEEVLDAHRWIEGIQEDTGIQIDESADVVAESASFPVQPSGDRKNSLVDGSKWSEASGLLADSLMETSLQIGNDELVQKDTVNEERMQEEDMKNDVTNELSERIPRSASGEQVQDHPTQSTTDGPDESTLDISEDKHATPDGSESKSNLEKTSLEKRSVESRGQSRVKTPAGKLVT